MRNNKIIIITIINQCKSMQKTKNTCIKQNNQNAPRDRSSPIENNKKYNVFTSVCVCGPFQSLLNWVIHTHTCMSIHFLPTRYYDVLPLLACIYNGGGGGARMIILFNMVSMLIIVQYTRRAVFAWIEWFFWFFLVLYQPQVGR